MTRKWNFVRGGGAGTGGEPLFTLEEARQRLGTDAIPKNAGRRTDGFPAPVGRYGNRQRYRLSDLQAWLKARGQPFQPFVVEKRVPVPHLSRRTEETTALLEALQAMKVGDSIMVTEAQCASARKIARDLGIKAVTRAVEKGSTRRLWRME
jgi:hypothetical protein